MDWGLSLGQCPSRDKEEEDFPRPIFPVGRKKPPCGKRKISPKRSPKMSQLEGQWIALSTRTPKQAGQSKGLLD